MTEQTTTQIPPIPEKKNRKGTRPDVRERNLKKAEERKKLLAQAIPLEPKKEEPKSESSIITTMEKRIGAEGKSPEAMTSDTPKPEPPIKLEMEEIEELISSDPQAKHIEKGQNFLFPPPTEDIDLKTDLTDEDVFTGMVAKTAYDWFQADLGWLRDPFGHYERLAVSRNRGGRAEGLELQTQSKAIEKLRNIAMPQVDKEGMPKAPEPSAGTPQKKKKRFGIF